MWEKLERSQWMFGEILKFVLNSVYIAASPLPASNFVSFSMLLPRVLMPSYRSRWLIYFYSFEISNRVFFYLFIYVELIDEWSNPVLEIVLIGTLRWIHFAVIRRNILARKFLFLLFVQSKSRVKLFIGELCVRVFDSSLSLKNWTRLAPFLI